MIVSSSQWSDGPRCIGHLGAVALFVVAVLVCTTLVGVAHTAVLAAIVLVLCALDRLRLARGNHAVNRAVALTSAVSSSCIALHRGVRAVSRPIFVGHDFVAVSTVVLMGLAHMMHGFLHVMMSRLVMFMSHGLLQVFQLINGRVDEFCNLVDAVLQLGILR